MRVQLIGAFCALAMATAGAAHAQEAPASAQAGDLTVRQGHMMGWAGGGTPLGGEVAFTVENAGTAPDRVVSVSTPAGPVGAVSVQVARDGRAVSLAPGDATLAAATDAGPGLSRVTAQLTGLSHGAPSSVLTTITVTFERAGPVTVSARPVSPAPPPG
ncbi:hypothetical protein [Brevundimonas sp.]|uniref:hypothetical protein n=1 Tax=Brevundimonas sp. TaxID=1871086 RepID=UPI00262A242E|nr:hypothetical protein [Brevundimonas sp.]